MLQIGWYSVSLARGWWETNMKNLILLICLTLLPHQSFAWNTVVMCGNGESTVGGGGCSGDYGPTLETGTDGNATNYRILLTRISLDCDGTIENINGWLGAGEDGDHNFVFVLYDDDGGSGEPGTLLWNSSFSVVQNGQPQAWYDDISISEAVTAGYVWAGIYVESGQIKWTYNIGAGEVRWETVADYQESSIPSPWVPGDDDHSTAERTFYIGF